MFVAYPRPAATYGTAEHLQSVGSGYFGLNGVLGIYALAFLLDQLLFWIKPSAGVVGFLVAVVVVSFLFFEQNLKIADGQRWPKPLGAVFSLAMGLFSALCGGVFGYLVMKVIAGAEMRKYGLSAGLGGMKKKKEWKAMVVQMQQANDATLLAPPFTLPASTPPKP